MASAWPVSPVPRAARLLGWAVLLAAVGLLLACVVVPRLAGASTYVVVTGSMRPDLRPGTLVVVRPAEPRDLGVGSVVTYQVRPDDPEVVTHRVVEVGQSPEGRVLRTKGDANDSPDPRWVRPVQVRGTVWYAVPLVGRLAGLVAPDVRQVTVRVLAGGLAAYAVVMFVGAARDRRRVVGHG